jgi:hypothetical protein
VCFGPLGHWSCRSQASVPRLVAATTVTVEGRSRATSAFHVPAFHAMLPDNFAVAMVRPRARVASLSSSELINCLKPAAHQAGRQRDVRLLSGLAVSRLMRHGSKESGVVSGKERPQLRCHIIPVAPYLL